MWLYAIQAGHSGPVKLGLAKVPAERLATLQVGNADQLRGLAAWRVDPVEERRVHEDFAHARIRGEWFRPVPELIDYVLLRGCDFDDWDLAQRRRDQIALQAGRGLDAL